MIHLLVANAPDVNASTSAITPSTITVFCFIPNSYLSPAWATEPQSGNGSGRIAHHPAEMMLWLCITPSVDTNGEVQPVRAAHVALPPRAGLGPQCRERD